MGLSDARLFLINALAILTGVPRLMARGVHQEEQFRDICHELPLGPATHPADMWLPSSGEEGSPLHLLVQVFLWHNASGGYGQRRAKA